MTNKTDQRVEKRRLYIGNNYGIFLSEFPHQKKQLYFSMKEVLEIDTQTHKEALQEALELVGEIIDAEIKEMIAEGTVFEEMTDRIREALQAKIAGL